MKIPENQTYQSAPKKVIDQSRVLGPRPSTSGRLLNVINQSVLRMVIMKILLGNFLEGVIYLLGKFQYVKVCLIGTIISKKVVFAHLEFPIRIVFNLQGKVDANTRPCNRLSTCCLAPTCRLPCGRLEGLIRVRTWIFMLISGPNR